MPKMVAFLRGINVGGHRVTGDELAEILCGLGMSDISTYRASGNLIFSSPNEDEGAVAENLETGLAASLGYDVPVLLRSAEAAKEVAAQTPFVGLTDRGKHQVIFMRSTATARMRAEAEKLVGGNEVLAFSGRELHWSPSAGVIDSDIDLDAIEALLGPTTMRTMGTVAGIAKKLS